MNTTTTNQRSELVRELRAPIPMRAIGLSEAYSLAERQATKTWQLLGIRSPGASLGWITELPRVEVKLMPRYTMNGLAGATKYARGRYLVLITKNDAHARRRWTLAHEFKHILDYTNAKALYAQLGYGDAERREQLIEKICNHFAANLLMPRPWVKHAYGNGIQELSALAGLFNVSEEAMHNRLVDLGIVDNEPDRPTPTYFRRTGWIREWGPAPNPDLDFGDFCPTGIE
jgi:predicted transcriptional regulator